MAVFIYMIYETMFDCGFPTLDISGCAHLNRVDANPDCLQKVTDVPWLEDLLFLH